MGWLWYDLTTANCWEKETGESGLISGFGINTFTFTGNKECLPNSEKVYLKFANKSQSSLQHGRRKGDINLRFGWYLYKYKRSVKIVFFSIKRLWKGNLKGNLFLKLSLFTGFKA